MKAQNRRPKLHLITNPKRPDVLVGVTDTDETEPAMAIPLALVTSYSVHPSNAEAPAS